MSHAALTLNPYLAFSGNCREALEFYATLPDARLNETFTFEGSPLTADLPAEWHSKIMHGSVNIGGQIVMACDSPPGHGAPGFNGVSLSITVGDADRAETYFKALSSGATITMPMQETFFAKRFGMLTDRFGVPWMVHCEGAA
jgi:PhnB protein